MQQWTTLPNEMSAYMISCVDLRSVVLCCVWMCCVVLNSVVLCCVVVLRGISVAVCPELKTGFVQISDVIEKEIMVEKQVRMID